MEELYENWLRTCGDTDVTHVYNHTVFLKYEGEHVIHMNKGMLKIKTAPILLDEPLPIEFFLKLIEEGHLK